MILSDQREIIKALSAPETYGKSVKKVTIRHSHIAYIFFAGDYVYKLKRAVMYPGVDFSTPEKRKLACIAEMKRSTVYAPHLILGVKPIRRLKNGKIKIGGTKGEEIDSVIVEKRLPNKAILNCLLPSDCFGKNEARALAEHLAELHSKAKVFHSKWGVEVIQHLILENESILSCFPNVFDVTRLNVLTGQCLEILRKNESLIRFRQKSGRVRKCHGDLLLSNIACHNGKFLFFSPIEYNDSLDCIDTLYDLAFLTMDLEAKGLSHISNALFNHYMAFMNDLEGIALMNLYQAIRAMGRAAVCAKISVLSTEKERISVLKEAQHYFSLACGFLVKTHPILMAFGGASCDRKSQIIEQIASLIKPAPGAITLSDYVVKKQIIGLASCQKINEITDTPAFEKVVYEVIKQQTYGALSAGETVVIDATFYEIEQKNTVSCLAQELNIPFVGFWIDDVSNGCGKNNGIPQLENKEMKWQVIDVKQSKEEIEQLVIQILKENMI